MTPLDIRRIKVNIFGSVQGVGFRYAIAHHANELKIQGFVQNLKERDQVYFEAQGPKEKLEDLVNFARRSPAWSEVKEFKAEQTELKEDYPLVFYIEYKNT